MYTFRKRQIFLYFFIILSLNKIKYNRLIYQIIPNYNNKKIKYNLLCNNYHKNTYIIIY